MYEYIDFSGFMQYLFDDEVQAKKAAEIIEGILAAQSPRISNIVERMAGQSESNYRKVQRFLQQTDLSQVLLRLYQEEAGFGNRGSNGDATLQSSQNRICGNSE